MSPYEDPEDEEEDMIDESDEEELEAAAVASKAPQRELVYNTVGLHEKLEDFSWTTEADWLQTLAVTHQDDAVEKVDVNDDLAREMAFYTQAIESVKDAYQQLTAQNISVLRPKDYYAEMAKSDEHMLKVKDKLLFEKKRIEETEERRKQREAKKYSKEVQAEKLKERAKQKKQDIESVKKWRKQRQKGDFAGDGETDFPVALDEGGSKGKNFGGDRNASKARGLSKKRQSRDSKFGYGGRKGLGKQNDASSAGDMDGFRPGFKDRGVRGIGKKGGGQKGKVKRPGKARRQSMKTKG